MAPSHYVGAGNQSAGALKPWSHLSSSQKTILGNQFSPATLWDLGVELWSQRLMHKHLYPLGHLTNPHHLTLDLSCLSCKMADYFIYLKAEDLLLLNNSKKVYTLWNRTPLLGYRDRKRKYDEGSKQPSVESEQNETGECRYQCDIKPSHFPFKDERKNIRQKQD